MKFTTYVPTTDNAGTAFATKWLKRVIDRFWQPFHAMSNEGIVEGYWTADDGVVYHDFCMKISIECDRNRLQELMGRVRRLGRKLGQLVMYIEVSGYDGVQFLRIT